MSNPDTDAVFARPLPQVYQKHLVPLIFEPYAGGPRASAEASRAMTRVLESPPPPCW